jgi:copper chaperone CopZ
MNQSLKLTIEGMHCAACVRRVTTALQSVPGTKVTSVEVGSAKVELNDSETTANDIIAAVGRIGFPTHIAP